MAKLVHTVGGAVFREYTLQGAGTLRIGRNPDNDIQLDDDAVSGYHAEIMVRPSEYMDGFNDVWAKDLGSTNGTVVNGKPIKQHILRHDDLLKIGTNWFKFVDEVAAAVQTTRVLLDGG